MTTSEEDQAARARALDPGKSFVVEALAGSGKTSLLTHRLLVLLARVDEPESVLAVTFTRKAVEELRTRVLDALHQASGPKPVSEHEILTWELARQVVARDTERAWQLSTQPSRLRIQTIDGLAASLARRLPLTAGLASALEPADDPRVLYARAARETLACLYDDAYAGLVAPALALLDNHWGRAEQLLVDMLPRREQWLRLLHEGLDHGTADAALKAVVQACLQTLPPLPPNVAGEVAALAHLAGQAWLAHGHAHPDAALLAGIDLKTLDVPGAAALARFLLTAKGEPRKQPDRDAAPPVADPKALKQRMKDLAGQLGPDAAFCRELHAMRALPEGYSASLWAAVQALLTLLKVAVAQLDLVFDEQLRCDFPAVAQGARRALGSAEAPSEFALAQDYRLQHLLIDEFQDTSRSQFEFFETLVAGWTDDGQRTVLLVGDPRQSIYRFRQAEVGLFTQLIKQARFASLPLECLRLSANFRTGAPLINWLNGALPAVFAGRSDRLPPFGGLVATRTGRDGPPVTVHPLHGDDGMAEANAILEIIQAARARRPDASIAVLVRSRAVLGLLPAGLAAAGIPVEATDVSPLTDEPVVNDLLALTRALVHLTDRVAWLAVLRAPWCGVSLGGLAMLVDTRPQALVWELLNDAQVLERLSPDDQMRLAALTGVLATAVRDARRSAWAPLVEATWRRLKGPLLAAPAALPTAERYFELLAAFEVRHPDFAPETWEAVVAEGFAPVVRQAGKPVQLMTIHKSKGLEFDIVILPGLERKVRQDDKPLVVWHELDDHLLLAPFPGPGSEDSRVFDFVSALEKQAGEAEGRRLLYVALTRARDELHLCARRKLKKDGDVAAPVRGSFLERLWSQIATEFLAKPLPTGPGVALPPPGRFRLSGNDLPLAPALEASAGAMGEIEFDWATPLAKHVGTVTHLLLQRVAEEGLAEWNETRVALARGVASAELRRRGHRGDTLEQAVGRVMVALGTTLRSERGRWILSPAHQQAASELRLGVLREGVLQEVVLDRTFVADDGTRWIVDFKTSEHLGGSAAKFMDDEVERYREQLSRYAELMHAMDPRAVRLALYFPLLDGWREWGWAPAC